MAEDDELDYDELMPHTIAGQLATVDKASRDKLSELVTLSIDGRQVTIPRVLPKLNPNYEIIRDKKTGEATFRYATVYDAASIAYSEDSARVAQAFIEQPDLASHETFEIIDRENPIPILCHQPHMTPVAVCRACLVEIESADGKERSLAPACHRTIDNGVKISTIRTSRKVQKAVSTVLELLMSDQPEARDDRANELHRLYEKVQQICRSSKTPVPSQPRFPSHSFSRATDLSSPIIAVDHSACILCDRCVRACGEVKHNEIIGRGGKGYSTEICFDLHEPMGQSNCVECGECAISCPTDALTLRKTVAYEDLEGEPVSIEEVLGDPLFEGISEKFLAWIIEGIRRRRYKKGDVVCREGEYGSYAFRIRSGRFLMTIKTPLGHVAKEKQRGWIGQFMQHYAPRLSRTDETAKREGEEVKRYIPTGEGIGLEVKPGEDPIAIRTAADVLFGEMACLNKHPRSATVIAMDDDAELLLIPANVIHVLRRNPESRSFLEHLYRTRTIETHLRTVALFNGLQEDAERFNECIDRLRDNVELILASPGQVILRQGDLADAFYLVRLGFIRISQKGKGGSEIVTNYVGPGGSLGELAVLGSDPKIALELGLVRRGMPPGDVGRRNATATAMDHVELIRINRSDLLHLYRQYPEIAQQLRARIHEIQSTRDKVAWDQQRTVPEIIEQGMMNAQKLLVLDLESCTRCDECTKACADAHEGQTRLIREGLRIDKYLIATACRSCQDPYCQYGCPVDAIHRKGSLEIIIEKHCIGCGLCATNCPYGNIIMQPALGPTQTHADEASGRLKAVVQMKATTCDLCMDTPSRDPSCVYACPHDAAHRLSGVDLMNRVLSDRQAEDRIKR